MTIDRILSIIATIVSFVAVPASGYLSYRYAIVGEKRKEFNLVSDPLRLKFREQMRLLELNLYPAGGSLSVNDAEIESLIDVSDSRLQSKIASAWDVYQKSLEELGEPDEYGDYKINDATSVKVAIIVLISYIKRK